MKKFAKSILGVTLLEIMLVLAIAAMIIVMSVRYYQSASAGQQANSTMATIANIVAAAESMAQSTGSYASVTSDQIKSIVGVRSGGAYVLNTPWGTAITVTMAATTVSMALTTIPASVCNLLAAKLTANNHYSLSAACPTSGTGSITVIYTASV